MLPRLFIGGTGRSGTTILYKALGAHRDIYALPWEMRFIVDPDGLMTLIDSLTDSYSPPRAGEALYRFERLMRVYLTTPKRGPYPQSDFDDWLGGSFYRQQVDRFIKQLVEVEFEGSSWVIRPDYEGRLVMLAKRLQKARQRIFREPVVPFELDFPRQPMKTVKYFSDRQQLVALAADLVESLFMNVAQENGKRTWCEKTPQNVFHIPFLWELFPDSRFLHIKRDPRGVVQSLTRQIWAPSNIHDAAVFLSHMFDRWFDVKAAIADNDRYYELKLEDLAESTDAKLAEIAAFCGLRADFVDLPDIQPERVNYWREQMTAVEIDTINNVLGDYIGRMGYTI